MENNLEMEILHKMRSLHNSVKRVMSRTDGDNSKNRILRNIRRQDGLTQSQLADRLEIRPQSLTRVLSELELAGLIVRKRNENDRRVITLHITEKGEECCSAMKAVFQERAEEMFSVLDSEEKKELYRLIEKVLDGERRKEETYDQSIQTHDR
ncbi:MAG: MarR family transcriptional regulator [Erysipelotrichaceae bacterium]|nr:MarR family transcriptional regulator [Erysipelotrichaceae bacterium]